MKITLTIVGIIMLLGGALATLTGIDGANGYQSPLNGWSCTTESNSGTNPVEKCTTNGQPDGAVSEVTDGLGWAIGGAGMMVAGAILLGSAARMSGAGGRAPQPAFAGAAPPAGTAPWTGGPTPPAPPAGR